MNNIKFVEVDNLYSVDNYYPGDIVLDRPSGKLYIVDTGGFTEIQQCQDSLINYSYINRYDSYTIYFINYFIFIMKEIGYEYKYDNDITEIIKDHDEIDEDMNFNDLSSELTFQYNIKFSNSFNTSLDPTNKKIIEKLYSILLDIVIDYNNPHVIKLTELYNSLK